MVIGEIGWATSKANDGLQLRLMKGEAGVGQQLTLLKAVGPWAARNKIPVFFFEAFDEPWKGDANPAGAEKHWGLFKSDRSPKLAGKWLLKYE